MNSRKLIEVALPLEAINRESAREKSIRHGHPSTLHLWWARRPLAATLAVLFARGYIFLLQSVDFIQEVIEGFGNLRRPWNSSHWFVARPFNCHTFR